MASREHLLNSARYVYILAFFLLLSGVFSPIITGTNYELVLVGTLVLFVGLLGGIFLYNGITKNNKKFFTLGMILIPVSLIAIMMLSYRG